MNTPKPKRAKQKASGPSAQIATQHQQSLPGENASSEAAEQGAAREKEEEKGLKEIFCERVIHFKSLSLPLIVLLALTVIQILAIALLLATQNLLQPQIGSGVVAEGKIYIIPLVAFIAVSISLTIGTWFALAGALRVDWRACFLVLALVTCSFAYYPFAALRNDSNLRGEPFVTEGRVHWIQLALLVLIWVAILGVFLLKRPTQPKGTVLLLSDSPWYGWLFGLVVASILLYYGLELVVWRAYALVGFPGEGLTAFIGSIANQAYLLSSFVLLLIYWYSVELLDWSQNIANSIFTTLWQEGRRLRLVVTMVGLIALGMLINEIRLRLWTSLLELVLIGVIAALIALVVRFARIHSKWPTRLPALTLLPGTIILYLQFGGIPKVNGFLAAAYGLAPEVLNTLNALVPIPVLLAALTIGLVLVARSHQDKPNQGVAGLFLVMMTLLSLMANLPSLLNEAGFPVAILQQPYSLLGGLILLAAGGTLVWIGYVLMRHPQGDVWKKLPSIFLLLISLQAIGWLNDLAKGRGGLENSSVVALGVLFVLNALWDLLTSGEQTNADTPGFPREERVLLYLGYTLIATSMLLYVNTLHLQTTNPSAPDYLFTSDDERLGLLLLGPPLVVLRFLLSVIPRQKPKQAVFHCTITTRFRMIGSGALALGMAVIFLLQAKPHSSSPSEEVGSQPSTTRQLRMIGSGILALGMAMIFLLQAKPHSSSPSSNSSPSEGAVSWLAGQVSSIATQLTIIGSGVLTIVLVVIFLISNMLPRITSISQAQLSRSIYTAQSPGPACDTGKALWTILREAPISIHCLPNNEGTRITARPRNPVYIGFIPPDVIHSQNYRVSMRINFSNPSDVCVGILTRFSGIDYYESAVCADGTWELIRNSSNLTPLGYGRVARTQTYEIETEADGAKQSITINKVEKATNGPNKNPRIIEMKKASVIDGTFTTGDILLEVFNGATRSIESVVLSQYAYTSLPTSTSAATP